MTNTPTERAAPTPRVIRRAVRLWAMSAVVCALVALGCLVLRKPLGLPSGGGFRFVPIALGLAPIVVLLPFWHWRVRRLRRALFASRFRLCTHCGYDVSGLNSRGMCPECGQTYDLARDVAVWEAQGAPYTEPRPPGFMPWRPPAESGADQR